MTNVHVDIETFSELNVKKVGAYCYAAHPSTKLLCLAWRIEDGPVKLWLPGSKEPFPEIFSDPEVTFWAWNAYFEYRCFAELEWLPEIPLENWRCTMALAMYHGYPAPLLQTSQIIGVDAKTAGHHLIKKCCGPGGSPSLKDYRELFEYCRQDVRAESSVHAALPLKALPEMEEQIWRMTQHSADHGASVDMQLVRALQNVRTKAEQDLEIEMLELCDLKPSQIGKLAVHLGLDSVAKGALEAELETCVDPRRRRIMEIRLEAGKSSCAKLDAIELCEVEGKLHGMAQYFGAHTGRWAGRLVQLQNLPAKTETKPSEDTVALVKQNWNAVELLYPPLDFCSAHIRSALIPGPGQTMYQGDYGQIEARVLATMAACPSLIRGFSDPEADIYTSFGSRYGLDRAGGKTAILGLGFGMGGPRFRETCIEWGAGDIGDEKAAEVVKGYRESYPEIKIFWNAVFRMYWQATKVPGKRVTGPAGLAAKFTKGHLVVWLPSGRHIFYAEPEARMVLKEGWSRETPEVTYMGRNSVSQRWERKSLWPGLVCENVVQAVARDVMAHAVARVTSLGFEVLFTVHDEIVAEGSPGLDKKFLRAMGEVPPWASQLPAQLPLSVEGGAVLRFGK